jgi:alanine dehydrogenase
VGGADRAGRFYFGRAGDAYVSVGSISAAVALPATVWIMSPDNLFLGIVTTALGALAIYKHKSNIQRLMAGTENRLGKKKEGGCEMKITVLGAGAWGTALAKVLHENGNAVTLWDIATDTLEEIQARTQRALSAGREAADRLEDGGDFEKAVGGAECVVLAIPSQFFRQVAAKLKGHPGILSASPRESNLKPAKR